jgi:hypothetical protein
MGVGGVVPLVEQQGALARGEDVGGPHGTVGVPGQVGGEPDQPFDQILGALPVVQRGAVHQ